MKRLFVVLFAIAYLIVPTAQDVSAQTCVLSSSVYLMSTGGSGTSWIEYSFRNNTGGTVDFSSVTVTWDNPVDATLTQVRRDSFGAIYWSGTSNTSPQAITIPTITMSSGNSVILHFSFSGTTSSNFSISACNAVITSATNTPTATPPATATGTATNTPTVTPTGTYTPPATPTATMTPTTIHDGTVIPSTAEPTGTVTPTPTETPNAILSTFNGVADVVPVWTPDPSGSTSIELNIPEIDTEQVAGIALSVYQLLEQWKVFTVLLGIIIPISMLRWMYKFATKRDAPDPENYIDFEPMLDNASVNAFDARMDKGSENWRSWPSDRKKYVYGIHEKDYSNKKRDVSSAVKKSKKRF